MKNKGNPPDLLDDLDLFLVQAAEGTTVVGLKDEKGRLRQERNAENLARAIAAFEDEDWMVGLRFAEKTDMKDARLQYHMGRFYEDGFWFERKAHMAAKWYKKAAEQGHEEAKHRLAHMRKEGYSWFFLEEAELPVFKRCREAAASGDKGDSQEDYVKARDGKLCRRVKTGNWLPIVARWMPQVLKDAVASIHCVRTKDMSKELRETSLGDKIFGKEGPEHEGYGTGELQKWADKAAAEGRDPHEVNLLEWFKGAAEALDYHMGGPFDKQMKDAETDEFHAMRYMVEKLGDYMPELSRMSRARIDEAVKQKYYTVRYAPCGIPDSGKLD